MAEVGGSNPPPGSTKFYKEVGRTATTSTMATLLEQLGTVVTETLGWVGEAVETIVASPFLLLTTGILVLGGAVGILGRLLSRK